jgi:hypothetical protein
MKGKTKVYVLAMHLYCSDWTTIFSSRVLCNTMIEIMAHCEYEKHEPNYVFKMTIVFKYSYRIHKMKKMIAYIELANLSSFIF